MACEVLDQESNLEVWDMSLRPVGLCASRRRVSMPRDRKGERGNGGMQLAKEETEKIGNGGRAQFCHHRGMLLTMEPCLQAKV